jgi:hypothetical protein
VTCLQESLDSRPQASSTLRIIEMLFCPPPRIRLRQAAKSDRHCDERFRRNDKRGPLTGHFKLGVEHLRAEKRIALVTDIAWMHRGECELKGLPGSWHLSTVVS